MRYPRRFTINLTPEMQAELDAYAIRRGMSSATVARVAIERFLANPDFSLPETHANSMRIGRREHAEVAV